MRKIDTPLTEFYFFCECGCGKVAQEKHHRFPNTKVNRKLYGDLIHHDLNIGFVHHDCHPNAINISEKEFCELLNIEPRSKVLRGKL